MYQELHQLWWVLSNYYNDPYIYEFCHIPTDYNGKLDKEIKQTWIPPWDAEHMPERKITVFSVKHVGLEIKYPTHTARGNWTVSCVVTRNLATYLQGHIEFCSGYHIQLLIDGRKEIQHQKSQEAEEDFSATLERISPMESHRLCIRSKTGVSLYIMTPTVNGMELGSQEWRDTIFLRYGIENPDPTHQCDGCEVRFSISQPLD